MSHKTMFRLLLKLLGVYFSVSGIVALMPILGQLALFTRLISAAPSGGGGISMWQMYLVNFMGAPVELALGLYLFFGGQWIVNNACRDTATVQP